MPRRVRSNRFRLASINLDNLHQLMTQEKDENLFEAFLQYEINVLMMQEIGLNWSRVPRDHNWYARIKHYLKMEASQTKSKLSYNTHDKTYNAQQWGGTGILSYGKLSHFAMGAGSDPTGLGRWTWTRYRGKNGTALRCVSVYQPCENKTGTECVYAQHKEYLQSINDDRCPRAAFMADLDTAITEWLTSGDHIVISGDINDEVRSTRIRNFFGKHNMRNLIEDRYDLSTGPTTYQYTGTNRIVDGIWGTPNIAIERCGYLEPGDFPGNHSLLWVDITYDCALGHNPPTPVTPDARRLQLWNRKCTKRYLDRYQKDVQTSGLASRQRKFAATTTPGEFLTQPQAIVANAIDATRSKFMRRAEKKCRHLRFGAVQFSEATEQPRREIIFWETAIRRRLGYKVSTSLWKRRKEKALITTPTRSMQLQDLYDALKQSRQRYQEARKSHKEERVKFLDTLNPKDRDRLKLRERQRELGRVAKLINGKLESKSVTKIEINGQECNRKLEMETALKRINYAKVRASDDTAFLQRPLRQEFGDRCNPSTAAAVLDGTYEPPPNTDKYAKILLRGLATPPSLRPDATPFLPRTQITVEDHCKGWRKAKERTSSGMSGLHFGMFKANATVPTLAALDASIRSVAYTTGFSYTRWKKGLDVQLLKRSQDFRAEKLRTILLLEADFNMNNKAIGNDAMRSGERSNTLAGDNYGGRRNLQPVEIAMNAQLTYGSILARRGRAVIMSNDASGCYDRIAHTVAILALQRLGIPRPALDSMISTIQEMEHYIRTAFGDSTTAYSRKPSDPPPQGALQGNGAGPAMWSAISTILINAMHDAGFGFHDWSLIRDRAISLCCFAFVDDTDLIHVNNDPNIGTDELLQQAQEALNLWEGLLRATGGDLAPQKSYWYLVDVIRKNGKWTYATTTTSPGDLYLKNGTHRITRHNVNVAEEALGIQSSPDGSMKAEFKYLQQRISKWCDAIRTKCIKPSEAWYCLNSTIMKTIEYPLMATSFDRKQIDTLMSPLLQTALPLSGIQSRLPRKLVYGTLNSRGCNIKYPYWTQLIFHLQALLRHHHRATPSRDLLDDNVDAIQLHVGSQQPFWDLPFPQYGHLAPTGWIANTWESLQETPLTIKGPDITIPARRDNDVWLMDAFVAQGYDDTLLTLLNDCRLFLQATTLSDICTADGHHIDPESWNGQPSLHRGQRRWIKTYKPNRNAWIQWRACLRTVFLFPHTTHCRLRQPLGLWKRPQDRDWTWWKHLPTNTIYQCIGQQQWLRWTPRHHRQTTNPTYSQPTPISLCPINCVRVSIRCPRNPLTVQELNWGTSHPPVPDNPPTSLSARLQQLPTTAHWAVRHTVIPDDGVTIANAIANHQAVAVSDGSLKHCFGTAAYVIEGHDSTNHITGVNQVPGPVRDGDSHRCEVSGIYSVVVLIQELVKHHNISSGSITIACDNETSLRIFDPDYIPSPQDTNFDLVNATWHLVKTSPIHWKPHHVHGHQDKHVSVNRLPRLARLNVAMDAQAKAFWEHLCITANNRLRLPEPQHHGIYGEGWQIWNGDKKVARPSMKSLYSTIQDPVTQYWWVRHDIIPAPIAPQVDWDATGDLLHHLPLPRRRWATKHGSANCGVGTTLVKWKQQDDDKCPRCHKRETTTHVYLCTGRDATSTWDKSIDTLTQYLDRSNTDPLLQECLLDCLRVWRQQGTLSTSPYPNHIKTLIRDQTSLGWQNLLEGLPVKAWRQHQRNYYRDHGMQRSSRRWMRGLLQKLHHLAWNQWDHRCNIKHRIDKPREKHAISVLNEEITAIYLKGTSSLLPGDQTHLRHNLLTLLQKPVKYKKAWLVNVTTAQERKQRIDYADDERQTKSRRTSKLLQWMKTKRM